MSFTEGQWLQLDIGPPTLITAVVTKGRGDTGRKTWVTSYTVSYSNNTADWTVYKEKRRTDNKVYKLNAKDKIYKREAVADSG